MRLSQWVEAARKKFPKLKTKVSNVKWVCCGDPFKDRTRSGMQVWKAWCMWKKGSESGGMNRIVGRPKKPEDGGQAVLGPKPTRIIIDNKPMPKCPTG
jgi:hypothetical protein